VPAGVAAGGRPGILAHGGGGGFRGVGGGGYDAGHARVIDAKDGPVITYDFQIVGGGYDGAPQLAWQDDGKHPPPDAILVGVCAKGEHCGTSLCRRSGTHISYWTLDEAGIPAGAQRYAKQAEYVGHDQSDVELRGRVVYVVGGLLDPRNFGAKARVPIPSAEPMVAARVVCPAHWLLEARPGEPFVCAFERDRKRRARGAV
jgi:hypothetical protein